VDAMLPRAVARLAYLTGLPEKTFAPLLKGASSLTEAVLDHYRDQGRELLADVRNRYGRWEPEDAARALAGTFGTPALDKDDVADAFDARTSRIVERYKDERMPADGDLPPAEEEAAVDRVTREADQLESAVRAVLWATFNPPRPAAFAFDPDEPRDEAGKWTAGGGAGGESRRAEGERLARESDEADRRLDDFARHEGTLHEAERAHDGDPRLAALRDRVRGRDENPFGPDIAPPHDVAAGRKYLQEDHALAAAAVAAAKGHLARAREAAAGLDEEGGARLHAAAGAAAARLDRRLGAVAERHGRSLEAYDRWAALPAGHPQQERLWSDFDHYSKQVGRALAGLQAEAGLHGFFDGVARLFDRRRRVLERDAVRAEHALQAWDVED
jgi:hypothetical protein